MRRVAGGNANTIVAPELGISEKTVSAQMRSIMTKRNANDRTHTVAIRRGIIDLYVRGLKRAIHRS